MVNPPPFQVPVREDFSGRPEDVGQATLLRLNVTVTDTVEATNSPDGAEGFLFEGVPLLLEGEFLVDLPAFGELSVPFERSLVRTLELSTLSDDLEATWAFTEGIAFDIEVPLALLPAGVSPLTIQLSLPADAIELQGTVLRTDGPAGLSDEDVDAELPIEEPGEPPARLQVAGGSGGINALTGLADTIISPLGEAIAFTGFTLEATEPLVLDRVEPVYTAGGEAPDVALIDDGGGVHTVTLSPAPEPGHWLKLTLSVTGKDSGRSAELTVWVAHQPLDVNQDMRTNISDATAFGANWNGGWANTSLPPKP